MVRRERCWQRLVNHGKELGFYIRDNGKILTVLSREMRCSDK